MQTLTPLRIDYIPLSPNRTRGSKWYVHANEKKKISKAIWKAWSSNPDREHLLAHSHEKAEIDVTFYMAGGGVDDDVDNRVARLKDVIDALVKLGVFWDDAPSYLTMNLPNRVKTKGASYLEISVQYPGRD
jgi:hypothetical protein